MDIMIMCLDANNPDVRRGGKGVRGDPIVATLIAGIDDAGTERKDRRLVTS